jgi:hypothetical protein
VKCTHYTLQTDDRYMVNSNLKVVSLSIYGQKVGRALRDARTRNYVRIHVLDCISQVGDYLGLRLREFTNRPVNSWSVLLGSKSSKSSKRSLCGVDAVFKVPNPFDKSLDTATVRVHVSSHLVARSHILSRRFIGSDHVRHE